MGSRNQGFLFHLICSGKKLQMLIYEPKGRGGGGVNRDREANARQPVYKSQHSFVRMVQKGITDFHS